MSLSLTVHYDRKAFERRWDGFRWAILNFDIAWTPVRSFTPRSLYPKERTPPRHLWDRKRVGPQNDSGRCGERVDSWTRYLTVLQERVDSWTRYLTVLQESDLIFLRSLARNFVSILNILFPFLKAFKILNKLVQLLPFNYKFSYLSMPFVNSVCQL